MSERHRIIPDWDWGTIGFLLATCGCIFAIVYSIAHG